MIIDYVIPVIVLLLIGGSAGVVLTFAAKTFAVEVDETVSLILAKLPGTNCGACGQANCAAYAEAIKKGVCQPNLCKPGGAEAAEGIGEVLGISVTPGERETAFVHCGGVTTEHKFKYIGTLSCVSAIHYYNGKSNCKSGCLGYGDCKRVCAYGAISIAGGAAFIDRGRCWACGLCVMACPKNLISLRKHSERVKVMCKSRDAGKETRAVCANGCLACGICVKKCMKDAIKIIDNHAVIDYDICTSCDACARTCPTKCIAIDGYKRAEANLREIDATGEEEILPI